MKIILKLVLIFLILNLITPYVLAVSSKLYILEQYENNDCTGELVYHRALIAKSEYCFRTLWFPYAKINCDKSIVGDVDADCFVSSDCNCVTDDCKTYYKIGETCINGTRILHQKLNYFEKNYCVVSEGDNPKQIGRYKPDGVTVVKRNYCYDGTKMDCDIINFNFYDCQSGALIYNSLTLSLALQKTFGYGNITFYLGDLGFLTAPDYNIATSLFKNNSGNIYILLISTIISFIFIYLI